MNDILHSEACAAAIKGKTCPDCRKLYYREIKSQQRAKELDKMLTRVTASKKKRI